MKTIPCKECLVLAACRSREVVSCDLLESYFVEQLKNFEFYHDAFMTMNKYLPRLIRIYGNGRIFAESIRSFYKKKGIEL